MEVGRWAQILGLFRRWRRQDFHAEWMGAEGKKEDDSEVRSELAAVLGPICSCVCHPVSWPLPSKPTSLSDFTHKPHGHTRSSLYVTHSLLHPRTCTLQSTRENRQSEGGDPDAYLILGVPAPRLGDC